MKQSFFNIKISSLILFASIVLSLPEANLSALQPHHKRAWAGNTYNDYHILANYSLHKNSGNQPKSFSTSVNKNSPAGYKPFYISHYGRHGARLLSKHTYFKTGIEELQKAASEHNLTKTGLELLQDMETILGMHEGMFGILSQKGGKQHREIATHMSENFPEVFSQKDRHEVVAVSSVVPRCLLSMNNFTNELQKHNPNLNFNLLSGNKYMNYIVFYPDDKKEVQDRSYEIYDSLIINDLKPSNFYEKIFINPEIAQKEIENKSPNNKAEFFKSLYFAGASCNNIDNCSIDIFKYFSNDEIYQLWRANNTFKYSELCNSSLFGYRNGHAAKNLLRDIISRADYAIGSSNNIDLREIMLDKNSYSIDNDQNLNTSEPKLDGKSIAADLRFGHESGLMPLLSLLRIDGFDKLLNPVGVESYWLCYDYMPMASNIQFIFYKKDSVTENNILVKVLYNEKETFFPELTPWVNPEVSNDNNRANGYFYKWSDLKAYFYKLL